MSDKISSGSVVRYPYLWRWQYELGREHGEKERPVCLALALKGTPGGLTHLMILPISGTPPFQGKQALEIPPLELRRAGLSLFKRGWITVGEYNYDIAERSFCFDPGQEPLGKFGPSFLEEIRQALRPLLTSKTGKVDRIG